MSLPITQVDEKVAIPGLSLGGVGVQLDLDVTGEMDNLNAKIGLYYNVYVTSGTFWYIFTPRQGAQLVPPLT
jgi:hypothetical protein